MQMDGAKGWFLCKSCANEKSTPSNLSLLFLIIG